MGQDSRQGAHRHCLSAEVLKCLVLVNLGSHNKHQRMGNLNDINLFLTVLEVEKSKVKVLAD